MDVAATAYIALSLDGTDTLLMAADHSLRRELSRRIRDDLIHLGIVQPGPRTPMADGATASPGDLIVCTRNDHSVAAGEPGRTLANGDLLRIDAITKDGLLVRRALDRRHHLRAERRHARNDLIAREKAGVNVRVILDQAQKSYDTAAYNVLTAGGVGVVWSSTAFTYTHQKTITVNNDESYVSTGNFDTTYYATSRDFGVFDTDANDVAAIVAVFNADYAHSSITPSDGDDLVWSPTDSQSHLAGADQRGASTASTSSRRSSATPRWSTPSSPTRTAGSPSGWWSRTRRTTPPSSTRSERRREGDRVLVLDRLLHPRQDGHRRLRRPPTAKAFARLGELLEQLAERQPGTRADHRRLRRGERP